MVGRIVSIVVVALILAAAAWALWPRPVPVEIAMIARGNIAVTVEEDGIARIRDIYRVTAPVAGRLVRVSLRAGDPVEPGQTVATIEPASPGLLDERSRQMAESAVQAADAAVSLADANLAQATAQADYERAESGRKSALAERGLVSTQIEEQAALAAATALRNVEVARATLDMRRHDLDSARAALIGGTAPSPGGQCCASVPSPTRGEVLAVLTESEQVVQPGAPLMDLGDPADLEIAVDVLSTDAVRLPAHAKATISGWGGEPLKAEVKSISPTAFTKISALGIEEQRTEVVLDLRDPQQKWARLGHGFRVVAQIVTWEGSDRVLAPIGALFRRGEDWAVFTVSEGKAHLRTISLGQRNGSVAEVLNGLEPGELVISHPADTIAEGTPVAGQEDADGKAADVRSAAAPN